MTVFYGTYNVTYSLISTDPCGTTGPPGTLTLTGNADGSGLTAAVFDRGGTVTFQNGTIKTDGTFTAVGIPGEQVPLHTLQSGTIQGQVVGTTVTAQENVIIAPFQCSPTDPNTHNIIIGMTGPKSSPTADPQPDRQSGAD